MAVLCTLLLCVVYASSTRIGGVDFWLQAKIGEIISGTGAIPETLLFPFTEISEEKFNAHEWLASVAFHHLLRLLGEDGMPIVTGILGLLLFLLSIILSYVRSNGHIGVALLGGALTIAAENYRHVLRPELPSLVIMAGFWCLLEQYTRHRRTGILIGIVMLQILWANIHGSFILGPILVGIYFTAYILESHSRAFFPGNLKKNPYALVLLIASLACLVNPYGLEMMEFSFKFGSDPVLRTKINEWLPTTDPRLRALPGLWIGAAIWTCTLALMFFNRTQLKALDWLVFIAFTVLGLRAIRFLVYIGLAAAFLVPRALPRTWLEKHLEHRWSWSLLLAGIAMGLVLLRFGNAHNVHPYSVQDKYKFSPAMIDALASPAIEGNVLTTMELGAELIYRSYPRLRPSIDCRIDSYGYEYNEFNKALFYSPDLLREFVARYNVRYMLMDLGMFSIFQKYIGVNTHYWRIYYSDHKAILLQRVDVMAGSPAVSAPIGQPTSSDGTP